MSRRDSRSIFKSKGHWQLELNAHYPKGRENSFLTHKSICIGGAERLIGGEWAAGVTVKLYLNEEGEEVDWLSVGHFDTQDEANNAVWDNRYLAYYPA